MYQVLEPHFKIYQQQVVANSRALAEAMKEKGYVIVSGGTDTHLSVVDLRPKVREGEWAKWVKCAKCAKCVKCAK